MANKQLLNSYEGAFEAWKMRLAVSRIKALGFPKADWPDIMQDLAVVILEFEYDPNHDNGASEQTALYAVINRHLLSLMRRRYRNRRGFDRYLRRLGIHEDGTYVGPDPCVEVNFALGMDVERALSSLSEFDRAVAHGLTESLSKAAMSRRLGCQWNTIHKAMRRIREHFEELGIDAEGLR
jgi:DNA-directed RNA polymerase specialized sigma24 family protein